MAHARVVGVLVRTHPIADPTTCMHVADSRWPLRMLPHPRVDARHVSCGAHVARLVHHLDRIGAADTSTCDET